MPDFHMVVCMKVVPKPEEIRVNPETKSLDREDARSEFNPPDMNALEMALSLRDRYGGRISILSMGPPFFEPFLRVALAMGADEAILLSDRDFAGADTLATTYTLSKGVKKLGQPQLIFCGEESSDGATGQVPSGLAEWLGVPQLTLVTRVELDREQGLVRGRREIAGGYEVLEVPMPALLSVKTASNEPRFMDFALKRWAFEQVEIPIWDQEALDAEEDYIGWAGSPTIVSGLEQAATRERKGEYLEGSVDEIAAKLKQIFQEIR